MVTPKMLIKQENKHTGQRTLNVINSMMKLYIYIGSCSFLKGFWGVMAEAGM